MRVDEIPAGAWPLHLHRLPDNTHTHTHMVSKEGTRLQIQGVWERACREMYRCVCGGSWTYRLIMIMNIEQPASIKDNSGIIIPPLSFFLSFFLSCSSVVSLYPSSYLSGTLLGRRPRLFTFNFSPWILIARCVFPGSVLIRIMMSASDSAASAASERGKKKQVVFVMGSAVVREGPPHILLTLLFLEIEQIPARSELIWSYPWGIISLDYPSSLFI